MHRLPTDFTKMDGRSEAFSGGENERRHSFDANAANERTQESREQKVIICFCWRCQNRSPPSLLFPVVVFLSLPFVERVFHKMSD